MRPTYLQFRSPKEATPGPYNPTVTKRGKRLCYERLANKCTFGVSERFREYEILAKRSGCFVGPGTYAANTLDISKSSLVGGCVYRQFHDDLDVQDNGYFYVGNHLVYEPRMSMRSRQRSVRSRLDTPEASKRPSSARKMRKLD